jgi:hypothetical protein
MQLNHANGWLNTIFCIPLIIYYYYYYYYYVALTAQKTPFLCSSIAARVTVAAIAYK